MFSIRTIEDPVLRARSEDVDELTFGLKTAQDITHEMMELMHRARGVGLAGNQVGLKRNIFVYDSLDGKYDVIFNPQITEHSERTLLEMEGCLSIPGEMKLVPRYEWVCVEGLGYFGQEVKIKAEGLLARIFQHEIDHLRGRLIIDYFESSV